MRASLKSFIKKGNQEELHRFRVQVKKLLAFLTLTGIPKHASKLARYIKPVRKIFKRAGRIRNTYTNLEIVKDNQNDYSLFMDRQGRLLKRLIKRFRLHTSQYLHKIRKSHRKLKKMIRPISNVDINIYYQLQLKRIAALLVKQQLKELHACRKQIKILIYNFKLVKSTLTMGFNRDYLGQVQVVIGNWHDNQLAIELFSGEDFKEVEVITTLKKERTRIKNQLKRLTRNFYLQATTSKMFL